MKKLAASLIILAAAPSQALADVTRYDNSDLTFTMTPWEPRCSSGWPDCNRSLYAFEVLYPDYSPSDHNMGLGSGPSIMNTIDRQPATGSGWTYDRLNQPYSSSGGPKFEFSHTGDYIFQWDILEVNVFEPGDTIDASHFVQPDPQLYGTSAFYLATLNRFDFDNGRYFPYGQDFYIGIRVDEGAGYRYGYIHLVWTEDIVFESVDDNGVPTGQYFTRDLFLPTAWAMESEPNTPITVTEPSDCPADVNGDGAVDPSDFTAWIDAYNNNLPTCDQNDDGMCTPADFTAWVNNFNSGC